MSDDLAPELPKNITPAEASELERYNLQLENLALRQELIASKRQQLIAALGQVYQLGPADQIQLPGGAITRGKKEQPK